MSERRFTLLAEGTSDRVLLPIIRWMLLQQHGSYEWSEQLADFSNLPNPPRSLAERITASIIYYPADVLFVHRDADRTSVESREKEILSAFSNQESAPKVKCVPVIPVRMTETWLLISESALRESVDNRNSRIALDLPAITRLESLPDPKRRLQEALEIASELSGRRKKNFHFPTHRARIPNHIEDWNQLLKLRSASRLYDAIRHLNFSTEY